MNHDNRDLTLRKLAVTAAAAVAAVLVGAPVLGAALPGRAAGAVALTSEQWALSAIGAPSAWALGRGQGVTIAVVDSGIDADHPDLRGHVVASVACIGTSGQESQCSGSGADDDGHGTHVAGIAAAGGVGTGTAGVAPAASLMSVRVLQHVCQPQADSGELCRAVGVSSDVSAGIRWAADHGAQVVNVSIGPDIRTSTNLPIGDAIEYAWSRGVIVVVAAGNDFGALLGPGYDHLPVVVVAATTKADQLAAYSNGVGDVRWGVAAPGGLGASGSCPADNVLSTYSDATSGQTYECLYGTSMAAPHVSGALAVLRSVGYSPAAAVQRLLTTAAHIGAPGATVPDTTFGYGRIDLGAAASRPPPPVTRAAGSAPSPAGASPVRAASAASGASGRTTGGAAASPVAHQPGTPAAAPTAGAAVPVTGARTPTAAGLSGALRASRGRSVFWLVALIACLLLAGHLLRAGRRVVGSGRPPPG